jgi:hypothetical protein
VRDDKFEPALVYATMILEFARSGFPVEDEFAAWSMTYEVAEPSVDTVRPTGHDGLAAAPAAHSLLIDIDDVAQLVQDLNSVGSPTQWAAAVIDDGARVIVTSSRVSGYTPPGIHLPHNVSLLVGDPNDEVYERMYGWANPVERLATYAAEQGWLDRITTLVAQAQWWQSDPFEWARCTVAGHRIELIELPMWLADRKREWFPYITAARHGGQHRLAMICPQRYSTLIRQTRHDTTHLMMAAATAAQLTIAAAKIATQSTHQVFDGGHLSTMLQAWSQTNPYEILHRRFSGDKNLRDAIGLPAEKAPELAAHATRAYTLTASSAETLSRNRYAGVREDPDVDSDQLAARLRRYAAAETVALTAEAIALWSADPLPVGDIEYAARMVTNNWI